MSVEGAQHAGTADAASVRAQWLGQAGFVLDASGYTLVIDPYLSDSLAIKYAGRLWEHERSFPPPVDATTLRCDLVICTHRHTDHMDPTTLQALLAGNPDVRICVPRAERTHALGIGVPESALVEMSADEVIEPLAGVRIAPIPAAHEDLVTDSNGEHHFLGVVVEAGGVRIYHSGDCVPYQGQAERLRAQEVDVALLPVNGRDGYRLRNGVPGNFFIDEALELCTAAGIPTLVGHHFGLFDFNTVDPGHLDRAVAFADTAVSWVRPEVGEWMDLPPAAVNGASA